MQCDLEIRVKVLEDRSGSEENLELVESFLGSVGPDELPKLLEQICDRENNLRISFDESMIEVRKAEENLNIALRLWEGPINNGLDAVGIHREAVRRNDET